MFFYEEHFREILEIPVQLSQSKFRREKSLVCFFLCCLFVLLVGVFLFVCDLFFIRFVSPQSQGAETVPGTDSTRKFFQHFFCRIAVEQQINKASWFKVNSEHLKHIHYVVTFVSSANIFTPPVTRDVIYKYFFQREIIPSPDPWREKT